MMIFYALAVFWAVIISPIAYSANTDINNLKIISEIKSNPKCPFYINFSSYPKQLDKLPIGVFDSGTGGLTVLDSILTLDDFNNETHKPGADGIPDFIKEKFEYLGDSANMPYGTYESQGKADFLRELIIKDIGFMLGTDYYDTQESEVKKQDKEPVKVIVIACNTATAYGLETIRKALDYWGLRMGVIGIVEAGSGSAVKTITEQEKNNSVIGVMATEGTCATNSYPKTIEKLFKNKFKDGTLSVVQQGGIGIAGAIDGDKNYVDKNVKSFREEKSYFGPSMKNKDFLVSLSLWKEYNFDTENNAIFMKKDAAGQITGVQLNSILNYIKYSVTELANRSYAQYPDRIMRGVILGCTHYPYFRQEIYDHLMYLKKTNGKYSKIIPDDIKIIDTAKSVADELYAYIKANDLFGDNSNKDSLFFITVPNLYLKDNKLDSDGKFTFEYKYGRDVNTPYEYVKFVPFSKENIDTEIVERIKNKMPATYKLMSSDFEAAK